MVKPFFRRPFKPAWRDPRKRVVGMRKAFLTADRRKRSAMACFRTLWYVILVSFIVVVAAVIALGWSGPPS